MEKIAILRLNEDRSEYTMTKQIPKDMRNEIFKRVGSQFDSSKGTSSTEIIRGLTPELEKYFLPKIIGMSSDNALFEERARDYWADFVITPTSKGLRFNIGTHIVKQKVKQEDGSITENDLEVPDNLDDYMRYHFALQSDKVASRPDQLDNAGHYDFILEDLSEVRQREVSEFEMVDQATTIYARLSNKFAENIDKIDWILEMTKENTFYDSGIDTIDKKIELKKLADGKPTIFIKLAGDPELELKAFLSSALSNLVISKEGNNYFYLSEDMGSEEKGALAWLKRPEKSGAVAAIKAKLEAKVKDRKQTINK